MELRAWLDAELVRVGTNVARKDKQAQLKWASKVIDLYNVAFHELTRQVRLHNRHIQFCQGTFLCSR